jgi:hypothetical protein
MTLLTKISSWFDNLVNESYQTSDLGLALFRMAYALYFLILGVPLFFWIGNNPDILFDPPNYSLANFFNGFPPTEVLVLIDVLTIILFVFLFFGFKTSWTSIFLTLLLITGFSFKYSFGKIDHNIIFVILPLVMSQSGWGRKLSLDSISQNVNSRSSSKKISNGFPIFIMALFIGFGYFSAGLVKAPGWLSLDLNSHGVRSWVMNAYFISDKPALLLPYLIEITNPYFWKLLDITAVIFELSFLIAVFNKQWFKLFIGFGVIFHFANTLMIYIPFISMIVVYLLFIEWENFVKPAITDRIKKLIKVRYMIVMIVFYLTIYVLLFINNSDTFLGHLSIAELSLSFFIEHEKLWIDHIVMSLALLVVLYFGYQKFMVYEKESNIKKKIP